MLASLENFFPRLPRGVKACQGGLEHFFSHICPFDRRGGGILSYFGNAHLVSTHFKKGLLLFFVHLSN